MVPIPQICHGDSFYVETERLVDNVRRLYVGEAWVRDGATRRLAELVEVVFSTMDSLRLMAGIGSRGGAETRRWGDVGVSSGNAEPSLGVFCNAPSWGLAFPGGGAAGLMI
jgi:hypothetical protein